MAEDVITAKSMAMAARFDPQFAVPARPRLRRGLAIRKHPDRLVVEGTPTRHVLRGKAATELVPDILPLLDGVRDHRSIAAELEVPQESIFAALSLLWTCGVVEDSSPPDVDTRWIPDHLADFLSRVGDSTEANSAWELAAQRLGQARLRLAGPPDTVELIRAELATAFPDLADASAEGLDSATLVVLAGSDPTLAQHCWDNDIPLLHVSLTSSHAEIGPYAHRPHSPCLPCQLAANPDDATAATQAGPAAQPTPLEHPKPPNDGPDAAVHSPTTSAMTPPSPDDAASPGGAMAPDNAASPGGAVAPPDDAASPGSAAWSDSAAWSGSAVASNDAASPGSAVASGGAAGVGARLVGAAMIAAQIVGLVSRATPVLLPVRWGRVDLRRLTLSQRSGVTRPGCPNCSSVKAQQPRPASIASRYDAAVALPPKSFVDLKAHQAHYQPANMALQRKHKTWPLAPRHALPALDLAALSDHPAENLPSRARGGCAQASETAAPRADASHAEMAAIQRPGVIDATPVDKPARATPAGAAISLEEIGLLLGLAAGWRQDAVTEQRPDRVFRWSASGGNIGSVVAYLVARQVEGLAPGIYGYLPSTHELALVDSVQDAVPGSAPASVVLVADLGRVAYKYGAFALRVVLLDAGCAQATMLEAARCLEMPAQVAARWDDAAVAKALAIELDAEPVTAIVHFGGTP